MTPDPQAAQKFLDRQRRKKHLAAIWARLAGLTPGMTILDIGSGHAVLATEYARLTGPAGTVYAVEPNYPPAEPAPNLIHLAQNAASPIALPAPPDLVFITDTLHHAADPAALLASIRAACGQNSRILLTEYDPAQPGLVGATPHRRLPPQTAAAHLRQAGFTIRSIADTADEHYAILAAPAPPA